MGLFNAILGNASEVTIESASKEFEPILIEGEEIEKAFRLIKDMFVFTNKRLIPTINKTKFFFNITHYFLFQLI